MYPLPNTPSIPEEFTWQGARAYLSTGKTEDSIALFFPLREGHGRKWLVSIRPDGRVEAEDVPRATGDDPRYAP